MIARLARVRSELSLLTRKRSSGLLDGAHPSVHTGRSHEFFDLREYVRGDDVHDIDWLATARHGSILVKRYVAERRTTLLLTVASGRDFAAHSSPGVRKWQLAVLAAGTLGMLATNHGDYTGLVRADGDRTRATRPSTRTVELERMLGQIEVASTEGSPPANLDALLATAATTLRRSGIVAVICDDVEIDTTLEARLRRLIVQHEVLWLTVPDLNPFGCTGSVVAVDDARQLPPGFLYDPRLRGELLAEREARSGRRSGALARLSIPELVLGREESVVSDVLGLLRRLRHA